MSIILSWTWYSFCLFSCTLKLHVGLSWPPVALILPPTAVVSSQHIVLYKISRLIKAVYTHLFSTEDGRRLLTIKVKKSVGWHVKVYKKGRDGIKVNVNTKLDLYTFSSFKFQLFIWLLPSKSVIPHTVLLFVIH